MNPDQIYGGIAAEFNFTMPTCNADSGGSVSAKLVGGSSSVEIPSDNVEGSGTAWTLTIPAALTADLPSGSYTLLLLATPSGEVERVVARVAVQILAADATDLRTTARVTLEALQATLAGKATSDQTSISYNGRSISRMTFDDLQKAIGVQKRIVKAEENTAAGIGKIQSVALGFVNA